MSYPLFVAARLTASVTDGDGTEEELRHARQLEEDLEWFVGAISSRPAPDMWKELLDRLRIMVDEVAESVEKEDMKTSDKDKHVDGGSDDVTSQKTVVTEGDNQKEKSAVFEDQPVAKKPKRDSGIQIDEDKDVGVRQISSNILYLLTRLSGGISCL